MIRTRCKLNIDLKLIKDVRTNCFCASLLRTQIPRCHVMHRARALSTLMNNDRADGHWRSVTPTFLFRNRFYLELSPHCPKNEQENQFGKSKIFKISVHGTWIPHIFLLQDAWNYGRWMPTCSLSNFTSWLNSLNRFNQTIFDREHFPSKL